MRIAGLAAVAVLGAAVLGLVEVAAAAPTHAQVAGRAIQGHQGGCLPCRVRHHHR
ncbi:hypothetical protein SKC41_22375 [Mycobacterium sp. 050128]|uniref:hypothetical protein n=1 Tax=Mycobacterium sp. 050128 TaxID=3096112 RepID=UPI002ED8D68A